MTAPNWLLYGANGYSGKLIAEEAKQRGHTPILAGRSEDKVRPLAEALGLSWRAFSLDDADAVRRALEGVPLVLHAAGPFIHTAAPMRSACLDAGAHYLDITGEIPVFEASFATDKRARERTVTVLSGVGFDVVPTDCLARYVCDQLEIPRKLDIAFAAIGQASAGTLKSALEGLPKGGAVRRDGRLVPYPIGRGAREVRFNDRTRTAIPIPWGDLSTAFHSTGAPDITTYMSVPPKMARAYRFAGPLAQVALRPAAVRKLVMPLVDRFVQGPDAQARAQGRSFVWARAEDAQGKSAEAWLETLEGYAFTAAAAVRAVEQTLALSPSGALTPSRAFGADFVLQIPETRRLDTV